MFLSLKSFLKPWCIQSFNNKLLKIQILLQFAHKCPNLLIFEGPSDWWGELCKELFKVPDLHSVAVSVLVVVVMQDILALFLFILLELFFIPSSIHHLHLELNRSLLYLFHSADLLHSL